MKETLQDGISRNSRIEQRDRNQINNIDVTERIHRQEHGRRRKAAIRRQKMRRRNISIAIVAVIMILIFCIIKIGSCGRNSNQKNNNFTTTEEKTANAEKETTTQEAETVTYKIKKPEKREKSQVYKILKKYAKRDSKMAQLYEDRKAYSSDLLNKVINNPEMIDFVLEYNEAENIVTGGLTKKEKKEEFPLFIQWDSRWAYASYGDSNIGLAGCGPTCLSMVIFTLTRNEEVTPDAIAKYSEENGFYVDGIGTSWSLMTSAAEEYGVASYEISASEEGMKRELDSGHMIICSVGPGDFTTEGHFIVIYGYNENGFFVNDPYSRGRSGKKWSYDTLIGQIRTMWAYYY
ncbi:MAG: C39 family peptidase [Eubacterium sp.]